MLKENADFIKKIDPKLFEQLNKEGIEEEKVKVIETKQGLPTLQIVNDRRPMLIHSKYNPSQEADRIIEQLGNIEEYDHVFFYGFGLGYHAEVLLKRYPSKKFSIFEPLNAVFQKYIEQKFIKNLPVERLAFLKVGLSEEETKSFIEEFFNFVQEKTLLVTLPSYERLIPDKYEQFRIDFKKIIEEKRQGISVNYSFQKRWTLNSLINLPETLKSPNILHDINKKKFVNQPAIIVAAGPSLNEELDNLKYIKEKGLAYIFTVGSAINTLIENGINPDAMCTYDPTVLNQKVFEKVVNKKINSIPMIYGTSVGFETLKNYSGPKLHMVTNQDTISNFYLKRNDEKDIVNVHDAPSIAVVTLELLYKLGCNPIILVGQNLAYKNKQSYSKGIDHVSNELTDENLKRAVSVKGVDGKEVLTDHGYNRMRSQIEYYLSEVIKGIEVINTTKGGAHIEGTVFKELSTVIQEQLKHSEIDGEWFHLEKNDYNKNYLENQQKKMIEQAELLNDSLRNIKRLFSNMEQLIVERKVVKLEKMFNKFDVEMKKFVQNDFYLTFLQPMSRVEFDLLTKDINALKFDNDTISKAKKTIKSFKRFVKSCEFDLNNMKSIFDEVNKEITEFLNESKVKDVNDEK
ncbi:motility associated factor glycosyltransferase family protein [Robertmurraya andreesenii]|uniref:6-hydroxymethylpterin diphosphokinase MptE-like domain-containing protein n=1 Tax=Anoxybacillus andreesenii TaxID=1325932 RepID=A0ABT9V7V4_9BACL|nr:6-hydroxymethylpterin diphosphokinase MptE-like protein [Robertmurraya andreesenii]MDQ0156915.1 hypothetical protein [Robertmurraya andreesenii]